EGVISLWRGNTANVIRYFPTQALNFAFKDHFKRMTKMGTGSGLAATWLQGGAAGACSLLFVYSLDYARTRLANDAKAAKKGGQRQFNGILDVYRKTLASDGITGLYREFTVGIVVYRGLYFGMHHSLKPVVLVGSLQTVRGTFFIKKKKKYYNAVRAKTPRDPSKSQPSKFRITKQPQQLLLYRITKTTEKLLA
ncbi:hypothetical protein EJB05_07182, partial [Eragrostis curvula]